MDEIWLEAATSIRPGVATLFGWWAEKLHKKLCRYKNLSKKVGGAKFTLLRANKRASLTLSIPLSTIIT